MGDLLRLLRTVATNARMATQQRPPAARRCVHVKEDKIKLLHEKGAYGCAVVTREAPRRYRPMRDMDRSGSRLLDLAPLKAKALREALARIEEAAA